MEKYIKEYEVVGFINDNESHGDMRKAIIERDGKLYWTFVREDDIEDNFIRMNVAYEKEVIGEKEDDTVIYTAGSRKWKDAAEWTLSAVHIDKETRLLPVTRGVI